MAPSTEKSPLTPKDGAWQNSQLFCTWFKRSVLVIIGLLLLQIVGLIQLIVYCIRTYHCGTNEQHPHYHCEKAPKVIGLERKGALIFELSFAISENLSRAIFLYFCGRFLWWQLKERVSELMKLAQSWPLLASLVLCEVRFAAIYRDKKDLGQELKITKATIVMYIIDTILITAVVAMLNFVKLRDLAEDIIGEDREIHRICCFSVTKKRLLFYLLKIALFSFWLQYCTYFVVVTFQIAFNVCEVDPKFAGKNAERAENLLKTSGQVIFMGSISWYLWSKLLDDNKGILGETSVNTETRGTQTELNLSTDELQSSLNYESCQSSLACTDV